MTMTSDQASDLSRRFRDLSGAVRQNLLSNWDTLTQGQRNSLQGAEYSLLNGSSTLITAAVGFALDESGVSFEKLQDSVNTANEAIQALKEVQTALAIAAAGVDLAGAIIAHNPGGAAKAIAAVYTAAKTSPG